MVNNLRSKGRVFNLTSSISGGVSFLGSYQICHNICLALVAALSLIGITIVGMPLLFLTKVALPFWIVAIALLALTLVLKQTKMACISKRAIFLNAGFITAGFPFENSFLPLFWIAGGLLIIITLLSFLSRR